MSPPFVRGEVRRDGWDGLAFFLCPTFNKPYSTSIKYSFQNGRDIKTWTEIMVACLVIFFFFVWAKNIKPFRFLDSRGVVNSITDRSCVFLSVYSIGVKTNPCRLVGWGWFWSIRSFGLNQMLLLPSLVVTTTWALVRKSWVFSSPQLKATDLTQKVPSTGVATMEFRQEREGQIESGGICRRKGGRTLFWLKECLG